MLFSPLQHWRLLIACLALVMSACTEEVLPSQSLIKAQSWRMDNTGQATLADVQTANDWQDLATWKSWGYGSETIWVRLQLRSAEQDSRTPWVIVVKPSYLDYVTLYEPAANRVVHTGDAIPPVIDSLDSINFTMQIPARPYEQTIYLQIRTSSARNLSVEVLPYGQAQRLNRLQEWLMGFATAASAILAFWASVQWWISREPVLGAFAIKQLLATAWAFFFLGFARIVIGPWLPEGVLTAMVSSILPCSYAATMWFFTTLMQAYRPSAIAIQACRSLIIVWILLLQLQWLGQTRMSLALSNALVPLALLTLVVTLLTADPKHIRQPIPLSALMAYMLIYSTVNALPPMMNLEWIQPHALVIFGNLTYLVFDGFVMFVMLQIRALHLQKTQQQIALDLQSSQEKSETEKRHREEQSQLFAMLAHEMKTPLAALRMWMDAGALKRETIERVIIDMNQVIERCVHTGQLADQGLHASWQSTDPVGLTRNCIQSCRNPERVDFAVPQVHAALETDPQMLSIVLSNLLDNACKYGAPSSRIHVSFESATQNARAGYRWCVNSQAGPAGLPDKRRLFEKYYRGPQARRLSGSGLGLFLVKGLLTLLQGSIQYEACNDRAVFCVWLPVQPVAR